MIKNTKSNRAAAILTSDKLQAASGAGIGVLNGINLQKLDLLRGCPACSQVLSFDFGDIVLPQLDIINVGR